MTYMSHVSYDSEKEDEEEMRARARLSEGEEGKRGSEREGVSRHFTNILDPVPSRD